MDLPEDLEASIRGAFNRSRGRLCGTIEAFGLPEKQERGAIATTKSLSYDAEKEVIDAVTSALAKL